MNTVERRNGGIGEKENKAWAGGKEEKELAREKKKGMIGVKE